ncbi:MAG: archaemetzincin [Kofleriaceae bacterium]
MRATWWIAVVAVFGAVSGLLVWGGQAASPGPPAPSSAGGPGTDPGAVQSVVELPSADQLAAIGDTSELSLPLQRAFDPRDHLPAQPPGPDDWLAQHHERPQTFYDYVGSRPNLPDATRRVIYLLPLGEFPADRSPPVRSLVAIVRAFFQLEVRTLPAVQLSEVTARSRTHRGTRKRQLLAPDVLTWLEARVPSDAYALMAITMEDLYPASDWNFVFGMASLRARVGVQSFARNDAAFFEQPWPDGWQQLLLRRASWTLVHEIGHMFGISHCVHWTCIMAGSNHQEEADRSPLHPCPVCLRKLWHAVRFDPAAREAEIAKTLRDLGISDEADWAERRAAWISE